MLLILYTLRSLSCSRSSFVNIPAAIEKTATNYKTIRQMCTELAAMLPRSTASAVHATTTTTQQCVSERQNNTTNIYTFLLRMFV